MSSSSDWPLNAWARNQVRRERAGLPTSHDFEDEIAERYLARAASRRKRFVTADAEFPRVASVNEDVETQR